MATDPDPLSAIQLKVDKSGRLTLPKEIRERLLADAGGVYGYWDGERLQVVSYRELRAAMDKDAKRAKSTRARSR